MDAWLAEPRNCLVIGVRADGRPHGTPNWFLWRDGRFHVSTTRGRLKYRMFSANPKAQIVVDEPLGFRYVMVDTTVEIIEDREQSLPFFRDLRAKHGNGGATDDDLRAEMDRDGRVTLVFTPAKPQSEWHARGF